MSGWIWWAAAGGLVLVLAFCRRPLAALGRLAVRSGLGMVFLWLFQDIGALLGVRLGVNLINALQSRYSYYVRQVKQLDAREDAG